jgi:hypothetical protein
VGDDDKKCPWCKRAELVQDDARVVIDTAPPIVPMRCPACDYKTAFMGEHDLAQRERAAG